MFAETLAGIALVKSAVDGIKGAIGTAKDVSEIADFLDQLFTGEQQIQKKKIKKQNDPFSVGRQAGSRADVRGSTTRQPAVRPRHMAVNHQRTRQAASRTPRS
jgi:hypothetical protein